MVDLHEHARLLGRLVANLQSLEFVLRAHLYAQSSAPHVPFAAGQSLDSLNVDEVVGENALTDYSSLGQLIDRYNVSIRTTHHILPSIAPSLRYVMP